MIRVSEDATPACRSARTGAPRGRASRLTGCVMGPVRRPHVGGAVCHLCPGSFRASL